VLVSIAYKRDGWYPEILAGMAQVGAASGRADEADSDVSDVCAHCAEGRQIGRCCSPKSATCSGRIMTGRKTCRESRRRHYCYLVKPTPSLPHMPCSSLNCLAAARRTAAGTDPECPNSRLAILPGLTHLPHLLARPCLHPLSLPFLEAPMPGNM